MYQPMLFVHWKQVRFALIPFIVAAFGLPLLSVQGLGPQRAGEGAMAAYQIVSSFEEIWLVFFPLLAVSIGTVIAVTAWHWDHQLNHVYSLSLPVARWEYAMLKMGSGVVLMLIPAAALWLGVHVAAASVALPEGMHAYPNQLALRFFLAMLISYALLFAMASGTLKTASWIVSTIFAFVVVGGVANDALAVLFPSLLETNIIEIVAEWLVRAGGPFEVFTGNWALIDV